MNTYDPYDPGEPTDQTDQPNPELLNRILTTMQERVPAEFEIAVLTAQNQIITEQLATHTSPIDTPPPGDDDGVWPTIANDPRS